jgi:hypothetical protein
MYVPLDFRFVIASNLHQPYLNRTALPQNLNGGRPADR